MNKKTQKFQKKKLKNKNNKKKTDFNLNNFCHLYPSYIASQHLTQDKKVAINLP